jgi:HK97 family phage prohead protease
MPYFITGSSPDCSGWATIKEDGEVMGCHATKQDAIDQMVAISIAEDITPGGERATADELSVGDFVSWGASGGRARGRIVKIVRDGNINVPDSDFVIAGTSDDPAALIRIYREIENEWKATSTLVGHRFSTLTKIDALRSSIRLESGPLAVIVDIDGTLIGSDGRIEKTNTYIEDMTDTLIFIITGRSDTTRDDTVKQLSDLNIKYNRLFMNSGSTANTEDFKRITAKKLLEKYNVILAIDNNQTMRAMYRSLGITALNVSDIPASASSSRAINQDAPQYMRNAAKRGLELNAEGKGGDGLTDKTIREARLMVTGQVSDDKWIRIAAWIARHLVDLDAPKNSNSSDSAYPGAGLVAHLLWGSGPSKSDAQRTMKYAEGVVARIREEESSRLKSVNISLRKEKEAQMNNKVERRIKNDIDFELRVDNAQADGMSFTGYAAVFNSNSEPLPFIERIIPGAFKRSLKSRNEIKLFKNHNMDEVLASTRSKTLRLTEDSNGLLAEATLPDTSAGRDLAVLMKRGDVHSMSFGFSVPPKGDSWSADGTTRELKEIRLHEVSIVTGFPAYEATTASVRSLDTLAQVVNMDADMLEIVMTKLHNGEMLSSDEADFMMEIVSKLREDSPMDDASKDGYDEGVMDELASLEIKRKHLDLLFKAV